MRYEYLKVILFWALVCTLPGVIFLVQVVLLMPANMMFAHAVTGLSKARPDWGFMLFFLACFAITVLLWTALSVCAARLLCRVRPLTVRNILALAIVVALFSLTLLPVYGGGGHGPMRWETMAEYGGSSGIDYWRLVLPATLMVGALHLAYRRSRLARSGR